jgi:hypothetical protein
MARFARNVGIAAGIACLVVLGFASAPLRSQEERIFRPPPGVEATIYRDANYNGPAVAISQAQSNLGLAWPVNSIRIKAGEWQLCEQPGFRGQCSTYDADNPMIGNRFRGRVVQSIRPIGFGDQTGDNRSLRGMAAEFFPAPARFGRRILACPVGNATANCAKRSADRFCRTSGWTGSARQAMETVNGRIYLADVLCTRTGR